MGINIRKFVKNAIVEDNGRGDLFFDIAPKGRFTARVIAKDDGVLAGVKLEAFDIGFNYNLPMGNGSFVVPNALEVFINFDISPNRLRNRKDFSRFY